jgi:hypothetical protein
MAMYSFVPPFREATFCGVPICVFDKLGCAAGGKRLRNTGLDVNTEKAKYIFMSLHQNTGQSHNIKIAHKSFRNVAKFK